LSNVVAPRLEGDEYQSLYFWYHASTLLRKEALIKEVHYESDDVTGVDDLIIYYNAPGVDAGGWNSLADFYQIKYHVDNKKRYSSDTIIDPKFINSTKSLLKRFYDAYELIVSNGIIYFRLYLISNWQWDQDDPMFLHIRDSDGSLPKGFYSQGVNEILGKVRESWRIHLGVSQSTFDDFARKLRFELNHFGRNNFRKLIMLQLENVGLTVPDDHQKADIYSSLALKFIKDGTKIFTPESLLLICKENNLVSDTKVRDEVRVVVIGIRSFIRFAERIEDECYTHICISKHFSGRHINNISLWNSDIPLELSQFLNNKDVFSKLRSHDHQILLECHGSIAFLAGYLLPRNSGAKVHPIQKGIDTKPWKPMGLSNIDWGWNSDCLERNSNSSSDIAIVISLTHNILLDVERFITDNKIPTRLISHFSSKTGIGQNSLENPDHAIILANSILQEMRRLKQGNPQALLHIFFAAPNAFMFFLGRSGIALGAIQLYEFDFGFEKSGSYIPSIKIPLGI